MDEATLASKEQDPFEAEAERAYNKAVTRNSKILENKDDDDDEFEAAFDNLPETAPILRDEKQVGNHAVNIKLATATSYGESKNTVNGGDIKTLTQKRKLEDKGERKIQHRVSNDEDERFDTPPLPQFAISVLQKEEIIRASKHSSTVAHGTLSPTDSVSSHPSTTSSDPSWSSDLRFSLPQDRRSKPLKSKSLEEAKEEWDHVETVTAGSKTEDIRSPMVTFQEAILHFQSANLEEYAGSIKPTIRRSGLSALWNILSGPPGLSDSLKKDRDLIFTLGLCPYDNLDSMHNLILQTVYKKLTATNLDCKRYGPHWEVIGFQGEDPATDLRGCGMLGLVNLLYFCSDPKTQALCRDVYRLSQDEVQNFPFSVMGINLTRITLQVLREGKLNKECNRRRQVFEVFHEVYTGIFLGVYRIWKTQQKTISDSGFVLREVETEAKKSPMTFSKLLHKTLNDRSKMADVTDSPVTSKAKGVTHEKVENFSGLCDMDDNDEGEVHLV